MLKTALSSGVRASEKSSTYPTPLKSCLGSPGRMGENGYASGFSSPAASLAELFEHPGSLHR
jgi:hypothetical protein